MRLWLVLMYVLFSCGVIVVSWLWLFSGGV